MKELNIKDVVYSNPNIGSSDVPVHGDVPVHSDVPVHGDVPVHADHPDNSQASLIIPS